MITNEQITIEYPVTISNSISRKGHYYKIITHSWQENTPSKNLSKTIGMSSLLDIVYNLAIGSKTKYLWKASTILGINPSNFLDKRQKGDMLEQSYQYAYKDKYVKIKDETNDIYSICVKSRYLHLVNYLDCRTIDKYGNPYRNEKEEHTYYKAKHYDNETWLINKAVEQWNLNKGLPPYFDNIK